MKRETVIRKLETIASRVDSAFCMQIDEIYLFGSALYKEEPGDIDLQIRYHVTEEDAKQYSEYYWKKAENLPLCQLRRHGREYKTKQILKAGMKFIDIKFLPPSLMITKSLLLIWSREKPDIRKNLSAAGWGTLIVKLLGEECANLRKQLDAEQEQRIVLGYAVRTMKHIVSLSEQQEIEIVKRVLINMPKADVNENSIRLFLRKNGFPENKVIAYRSKGSKVVYRVIR